MSYLVLARKYRPHSFLQMVGQDHVVRALSNALESGRLHHAYLFTGTRGVGKTTVSRILAKSLNCMGADGTGGVTSQPCGVCDACRSIDAGHFVDYTELDAASNRGVEDVQALLDQAAYKPVQGRYKVFMIDEVHMLSNTAFNAMLKTLEEPPEFLKFVLATTDPQKVPVTVLSRCLQFSLKPMAPETITAHLAEILHKEAIRYDDASLHILAKAARGSMRDALSLTDQAIAYGAGNLEEAGVRTMLGAVDQAYTLSALEALARGDGAQLVEVVASLREHGVSAASALDEITDWLSRIAVWQVKGGQTDRSAAQDQHLQTFAQTFAADELQLLYSICLHGKQDLGWALDEYAALTMVLLRYLAFHAPDKSALPISSGDSDADEKKNFNPHNPKRSLGPVSQNPSPASQTSQVNDAAAGLRQDAESRSIPTQHGLEQTTAQRQESSKEGTALEASKPLLALPVRTMHVNSQGDGVRDQRIELEPSGPMHQKWLSLVQAWLDAGSVSAMSRELAIQSQCTKWTDSHLVLRVEQSTLNNESAKNKIWQLLQEQDVKLDLLVEVGPVSACWAMDLAAHKAAVQNRAQEYILQSPLVRSVLEDFGGKILPQSLEVLDPLALMADPSLVLADAPSGLA